MRCFWLTLGFAVLHRLLAFGIAMLGFYICMTGFDGNKAAKMGFYVMALAGILDLPVVLMTLVRNGGSEVRLDHWGMIGMISVRLSVFGVNWSLCVGTIAAAIVYFRRIKRHGNPLVAYWKKGL